MAEEMFFFYSKSGFAPFSDGSGFQVTITIEQKTESSSPTISIDDIWRLPADEWVSVARKIQRMLDLVTPPVS